LPISKIAEPDFLAAWNDPDTYATTSELAEALGVSIHAVRHRASRIRKRANGPYVLDRGQDYRARSNDEARARGSRHAAYKSVPAPKRVERWLLTAAQDETEVAEPFWSNLMTFAEHMKATVKVGGFTYNKSLFEDHATRTAVFASKVQPWLVHEDEMLGPLLFAGKMNILPTADRPLSGLEKYSRGKWCVFPHAKLQASSVPNLPGQMASMQMTSMCCTVPNYIQKKAGLKAEIHHTIGATLVEIDDDGRVFCRQIIAAKDGSFQDLDILVRDGQVFGEQRVEQVTWGDIHREQIDPVVARACWGFDVESESIVTTEDTIFHTLKPRHQAFHDLLDFRARNHHRRDDHHFAFAMRAASSEMVEEELAACARFLRVTAADWCKSVNVASNHNDALRRWLRETDPRKDPANLRVWCQLNDRLYEAIENGEKDFDLFQYALSRHDPAGLQDIVFVPRNGSYLVCQEHGGIETSLHGDQGPNGARGSLLNLTKVAVRLNVGHGHSPGILEQVFMAGLVGKMDQGYNEGPSGWLHTMIVTYPNAKRTLLTVTDGKWRA